MTGREGGCEYIYIYIYIVHMELEAAGIIEQCEG